MKPRRSASFGSTLVVTLATLTALSLMAAFTLIRVLPRIRMAYQNAAWQEARVAAEAGVDTAMNDLLTNATGFQTGAWPGWKQEVVLPPPGGSPSQPPGLIAKLASGTLGQVTSILAKLARKNTNAPGAVTSTTPLYLDNLKVSAATGVPAEVSIRLWGLSPVSAPHMNWFRIRSMATVSLPPSAYEAPANGDAFLRRLSLHAMRPSLQKDQPGKPTTITLPNVSRTVEVLVEPILPFELALWTGHALSLAPTGGWNIDSFDSTDPAKSASGLYPGVGSPLVQANGDVACSQARPFSAPYGPLIAANGTSVKGAVATNGGDDPQTPDHENVSGAVAIPAARIRSDFCREMPVLTRPTVTGALPPPPSGSFLPGTEAAPTIYAVPGSLTQLRIAATADGSAGAIMILIDGDLDLAGPLILPPSVAAILFVRGNITFRDNVNAGPWNSNRAPQLLIFADSAGPLPQTLQALGAISVCAAFYGPLTDIAIDGAVTWAGSLAGASFRVLTGGDGGLHYDEALATLGPPVSFRISRYIEDVRE